MSWMKYDSNWLRVSKNTDFERWDWEYASFNIVTDTFHMCHDSKIELSCTFSGIHDFLLSKNSQNFSVNRKVFQ